MLYQARRAVSRVLAVSAGPGQLRSAAALCDHDRILLKLLGEAQGLRAADPEDQEARLDPDAILRDPLALEIPEPPADLRQQRRLAKPVRFFGKLPRPRIPGGDERP